MTLIINFGECFKVFLQFILFQFFGLYILIILNHFLLMLGASFYLLAAFLLLEGIAPIVLTIFFFGYLALARSLSITRFKTNHLF